MIYFDNNATTQIAPEVLADIQPLLSSLVGNPSSIHSYGQQSKAILGDATRKIAHFFGVRPDEVIYTSGATEALNSLIHHIETNGHIITSSLEHAAVLEPLKRSKAFVTYLDPLPGYGSVNVHQVKQALRENTCMIVLGAVNSETGIKIDIESIAQLAHEKNIPFIVDGVALLGKESFVLPVGVTAACFSGHKIHAPLGVGIALVRKEFKMHPLIVGGAQQRGLRAGTENLPGIVGFAKALDLLQVKGNQWSQHMLALRDRFENGILSNLSDVLIHGQQEMRVCNTSNIAFLGVDGETLLMTLDLAGLAASHGSACSAGALQPSRVLLAMGIQPHIARSSLRFSFSRFTTQEEIDASILLIKQAVNRLRSIDIF